MRLSDLINWAQAQKDCYGDLEIKMLDLPTLVETSGETQVLTTAYPFVCRNEETGDVDFVQIVDESSIAMWGDV